MSEEINLQNFVDRTSSNPNRRKLKIISQTPTEIIADIERADENVTTTGTKINANNLQNIINKINDLEDKIGETAGSFIYVNEQFQSQLNFIDNPQEQINDVNDRLDDEESARYNADESLRGQIEAEALTRQNAINSLITGVSKVVGNTGEITASQLINAILTGVEGFGDKIISKNINKNIGSYTSSNSSVHGYITFLSGLKIAWGKFNHNASGAQNITFGTTFSYSPALFVQRFGSETGNGASYPSVVKSVTTTGATVYVYNSEGKSRMYIAIGM